MRTRALGRSVLDAASTNSSSQIGLAVKSPATGSASNATSISPPLSCSSKRWVWSSRKINIRLGNCCRTVGNNAGNQYGAITKTYLDGISFELVHSEREPAPAPAGVNPKAPAKLSTVHGRITAALAELRAETAAAKSGGKHEGGKSDGGGEGHGEGKSAAPAAAGPRFVVSWPTVRWRVAWRDDRERVTVAWP